MPRLSEPALAHGVLGEQPVLKGLRPWQVGDAHAVREAFADPGVQQWHVLRIDDDAEAVAWIEQWAGRWAAEKAASWAVVGDDGEVLGQIGLRRIELDEAKADLSYWMLPAARGRGVAGGAVRTLTDWCFGTLGLHRLVIAHSVRNEQSCRVATKAGFALEGTHRDSMLHADGWHDAHTHARLSGD
ncbi:GNAT family N-acetyltransferase [Kribbella sp. NPDC051770]|uniref:GNAT family N-acetyltransferase n=1 Tax=Kribbella sp. NPDC051770 TaxID=3155413 RepID=UPI0034261083